MFVEILFAPWVLLSLVIPLSFWVYSKATRPRDAFDVLPWIGLPKGLFPKTRARFMMVDCSEEYKDAWEKYSSKGLSYITPSFFWSSKVILPPSEVPWILEQPENVLGAKKFQIDGFAGEITAMDPRVVNNTAVHERVIRQELTRALEHTTKPVLDELSRSLDDYWGTSGDWHDVKLWETMLKVFARTSSRIFHGTTLCRNEDFLGNLISVVKSIALGGVLLRIIPTALRPTVGRLASIPSRWYFAKACKYLYPEIERRLSSLGNPKAGQTGTEAEPDDFLQWLIKNVAKCTDPGERTLELIGLRSMIVSFAATHTTSFSSLNVLLDIMSAPPQHRLFETLREEVVKVWTEDGGNLTKSSLAKMIRMDSTIRESLRYSGFISLALGRVVMAPKGVTTPSGVYLPKGTHLAISGYNTHYAASNYADPMVFDPFRFSRPREAFLAAKADGAKGEMRNKQVLQERNLSAVSLGDDFYHWGTGEHACPGRFFAIQEIKLMLAHLLLNYEIKPLAERPKTIWYFDTQAPNEAAKLQVRKLARPLCG